MRKHRHRISAPLIPTWLDVQKKLTEFDQNHLAPNLSLTGEVVLPGVEEEVELLLVVDGKEIDLTSEEKEVLNIRFEGEEILEKVCEEILIPSPL